jgi:hypothetical protein
MKRLTAVLCALTLLLLSACGGGAASAEPDLTAFWQQLAEKYEMPAMAEATDELLDACYPGLRDLPVKQLVVKIPALSSAVNEYVFAECADAAGAESVRAILQRRIDDQAAGGAWYPASVEAWKGAQTVVKGNYAALVAAGDNTAAVVADFTALFG